MARNGASVRGVYDVLCLLVINSNLAEERAGMEFYSWGEEGANDRAVGLLRALQQVYARLLVVHQHV